MVMDAFGGGSRRIRVRDPSQPREPIDLSSDEAVLLMVSLGAYLREAEAHAAEDDFSSHTRDDMTHLRGQVYLLVEQLQELVTRLPRPEA